MKGTCIMTRPTLYTCCQLTPSANAGPLGRSFTILKEIHSASGCLCNDEQLNRRVLQ